MTSHARLDIVCGIQVVNLEPTTFNTTVQPCVRHARLGDVMGTVGYVLIMTTFRSRHH